MRVRLKKERLLDLLAQSSLSQNHWAIKIGLSRGHWSDLVNGKYPFPSPKTRQRLLEAFEVPFEDLFEIEARVALPDTTFQAALADRYLIDGEIGQGGMGTVYLARDVRLGRAVAIKVISPEAVSGIGVKRFLSEVAYVARLQHPLIVPLYDAGEAAGHPYYVMPYLRDGSLRDLLAQRRRLTLSEALPMLRGMASALGHAHVHQVLHCDVKPGNVLLDDGHAYVADFGVARVLHSETIEWRRQGQVDSSAGTPAYVSPEQANGEPDLDGRSDLYSLGCVAFEMLAGQPPFEGRTTMEIVARRFTSPVPDLKLFAPELPGTLPPIVERAMALRRGQRQASVGAFLAEVERAARGGLPAAIVAVRLAAGRSLDMLGRRTGIGSPARIRAVWAGLTRVGRDVGYAIRRLRRSPGLAATVSITFALGVGANATMFGIVDQLVLRAPPHVAEPLALVKVQVRQRVRTVDYTASSFSYPGYVAVRDGSKSFVSVAAQTYPNPVSLGLGVEARPVQHQLVSGNYFGTLGTPVVLGRPLLPEDDQLPSGSPVVVIGYGLWEREFGGAPDVVGQSVVLAGGRYTVVGVAPRGFVGTLERPTDVWIPFSAAEGLRFPGPNWATDEESTWMTVVGRLKPGVTPAAAGADVASVLRAHREQVRGKVDSATTPMPLTSILPGKQPTLTAEKRVALLLGAVSMLVLLIACANVANLLLTRALRRRREIAVRLALGVSRSRLVQQLVSEGFVLALLGGVAALAVIRWGSVLIQRVLLNEYAWPTSPLDARVLGFTAGATLAVGLLTALVPAVRTSRPNLTLALKEGSPGAGVSHSRLRIALLMAQAALSVLLLTGTGLFVMSLRNVTRVDLGVDIDRLVMGTIDLRSVGIDSATSEEYFRRAVLAARRIPGVQRAVVAEAPPFGDWSMGTAIEIPGRDSVPEFKEGPTKHAITPGYFATVGTRLLRGREITDADRAKGAEPVVVINDEAARLLWPGAEAIGHCVRVGGHGRSTTPGSDTPCARVVGVAEDTHRGSIVEERPRMQIYQPLGAPNVGPRAYVLLVRAAGDPAALVEPVRREMQTVINGLPYANVRPMTGALDRELRPWRLGAVVFGVFGVIAIVLSALGLYSVVGYSVAQRTHEMGVRMALGAQARDILRLVLLNGLVVAGAGVAIGIVLAVAGGRLVQPLLYEVSPRDPLLLTAVAALLLGVATVASLVPARRATRADPLSALRAE